MSLINRLRRKWQLMRDERARGEKSRQRVFESLKIARDKERQKTKEIQRILSQLQDKERRQEVEREADLLWKADGEPEGKKEYYRELAILELKRKNRSLRGFTTWWEATCVENFLEDVDYLLKNSAFLTILGSLSNLAVVVAVIAFIFGENVRRNNELFNAWQTITSAEGQPGRGGRTEALEFLNSRPLRFPWIGWTEKEWFWDEGKKKCKLKILLGRRWERQSLAGLQAQRSAYLRNIHLCGANLYGANLHGVQLQSSNLAGVNFVGTLLIRSHFNCIFNKNVEFEINKDIICTDLRDSDFRAARLNLVDFSNADLRGADFSCFFFSRIEGSRCTDLSNSDFKGVKLEGANLEKANLIGHNLTHTQIKSACNWDKAVYVYEGVWNPEANRDHYNWENEDYKLLFEEKANQDFIRGLEQHTASNPEPEPDCSRWEN